MKKIIKLFVLFLSIATISSCALLESDSTIQFTEFPSAVYYVGDSVTTAEAAVKVKISPAISGKDTYTLSELNGISGFQFSGFDFTSIGTKVLTVTYDTVSISYTYQVLAKEDKQVPDTTWYNDTDTEFHLDTAAELRGLAKLVNEGNHFEGKTVLLDANIDLGNVMWTPIGEGARKNGETDLNNTTITKGFLGTFDGQNHIINGLANAGYQISSEYVASDGTPYGGGYTYGLFGILGSTEKDYIVTIKNIKFANVKFDAASFSTVTNNVKKYSGIDSGAAVVGYAFGRVVLNIGNCHVLSGSIKGVDATAGIIGRIYTGYVQGNSTTPTMSGLRVYNCSNAASIEATRANASVKLSGICGITSVSGTNPITTNYINYFQDCKNTGTLTASGFTSASFVHDIIGGDRGSTDKAFFNNCSSNQTYKLFDNTLNGHAEKGASACLDANFNILTTTYSKDYSE